MRLKTDIAVIGTGAGGATIARELAKSGKEVLMLERGDLPKNKDIGTLKAAVFNYYDKCALRTSKEGTIIYRALMAGGTTVVSCGNGVKVLEDELKSHDIDLSREFVETEKDLGIKPVPDRLIGRASKLITDSANRLGFNMAPMPKFVDQNKCTGCGKCVLGCKTRAKWSALSFIKEAQERGAKLLTGIDIKSVVTHNGRAIGLVGIGSRQRRIRIGANKVIVAAGGIGTPVILERSGIKNAGHKLFSDFFNVTYGIYRDKSVNQGKELTMSTLCTSFMENDGFILSPYVDVPLVLRWIMQKRKQLRGFRYRDLMGVMVKAKDDNVGRVTKRERIEKMPTAGDMKRLNYGEKIAEKILIGAGVRKKDIIFTKPRAAHPGGSAAIGEVVDKNLKTKIDNLYVCDASVLPVSPGAPPIVTIVALAKRLSRHLLTEM